MIVAQLSSLFIFALVASITPGPNNIMLMTSGVNYGLRASLPHLAGVWFGVSLVILMMGEGLFALVRAAPWIFTVLHIVALIYMLYLTWRVATAGGLAEVGADARPLSLFQAAAFQWVNPKVWFMGLAAVTTFARVANLSRDVVLIAIVFGIANLPCLLIWTLFGTIMRRALSTTHAVRIFNVTMAILLLLSLLPVLINPRAVPVRTLPPVHS